MPDTAVVTGAARGIGRAVAQRLVDEGWHVVVSDRDADGLEQVAREVGGCPLVADVSSDAGNEALIDAASGHLGRIDLFVANAGIGTGLGLDAPDDVWARALDVNVLAHVRAARALVPRWLEAGVPGRFVVTASAAGLLTMLGDAPYSVTKHAAVAFAEWLAATYHHRGVTVHAICPQGVDTRMLADAGPLRELLTRDPVVTPEQVADALWEAMASGTFLVLPHPEVAEYHVQRASHPDAWLAGMNRLQQKLESTDQPTGTTPTQEKA
jgi:NAD(P)-dependent dehydrogenase (short-subunit alcohol dehydrogenase family)